MAGPFHAGNWGPGPGAPAPNPGGPLVGDQTLALAIAGGVAGVVFVAIMLLLGFNASWLLGITLGLLSGLAAGGVTLWFITRQQPAAAPAAGGDPATPTHWWNQWRHVLAFVGTGAATLIIASFVSFLAQKVFHADAEWQQHIFWLVVGLGLLIGGIKAFTKPAP